MRHSVLTIIATAVLFLGVFSMVAILTLPEPFAAAYSQPSTPKAQTLSTKDSLAIASPKEGETLTSSSVPIIFTILGDKIKLGQVGVDHVHIKLDGRFITTVLEGELLNFDEGTYTIANVDNGPHILSVVLATKDHTEFSDSEVSVAVMLDAKVVQPTTAVTTAQGIPTELIGVMVAIVVAGSAGALFLRRRKKA